MRAGERKRTALHDILIPTRSLVRATERPPLITLTTLARIVIKISFWSEATRNSRRSGIAAFFNPANRHAHRRGSCRRELIKLSFSRKHGRRFKRLLASRLTFRIAEFLVLSSSLGFSRRVPLANATKSRGRYACAPPAISIILNEYWVCGLS